MAKKNNKIDKGMNLDDLSLDFDADMQGFDDGGIGRNKKPIRHLATNFARGAAASFQKPENIKRATAAALPDGYGTAVNTGFEVYELGANLYNSAAEELRPAMPVIRSAVGRITSKTQRFLPKRVADKLKEFADREDLAQARQDADAEAIAAGVAEVFGVQMEEQAQAREEDRVREDIRAKVQDKRSMQSIAVQNAMLKQLERQTSFQDTVYSRALKKSLELQYRQTFYQRDMLQLMIAGEKRQHQQLAAIMHNTSLPEYRKTDITDAARQSFRDNLLNNVQQSAVRYASDFTRNLGQRLTGTTRNAASSLAMALNTGSDMRGMVKDQVEMEGGAGGFMANQLGSLLLPMLTLTMGPGIRRRLNKNEKWRERGSRLNYLFSNIPELANEFAQTPDDSSTIKGGVMRFLKDLLPRMGVDSDLAGSPMNESMEGAAFDKQTRRSIVEIIPGFLSRIHHELRIIRTKDESIGRIDYNLHRGEFTDTATIIADTRKRVMHPYAMETGRKRIDEFVDRLDPQKQLSEQARDELRKQILNDSVGGRRFDPKRYMSEDGAGAAGLSYETRQELREIVQSRFYDESGKERWSEIDQTASEFSKLKNDIPDPGGVMRAIMQTGGREYLNELGLVRRQGFNSKIDYDAFYQRLLTQGTEDPNLDEYRQDMGIEVDPNYRPIINEQDTKAAGRWFKRRYVGTRRKVRDASGAVKGKFDELLSIRKTDGNRAMFDAIVLQSKGYIDETTGKAIESIDDIKGRVVDRAGNVVAEAEDFIDRVETDHPNAAKKVRSLAERVSKGLRRARVSYKRGAGRSFRRNANVAATAVSNEVNELMEIRTVEGNRAVFDEIKLRGKHYFDEVSGVAITKFSDIKGNIVDETGKVVIRAESITNDWLADHPAVARKLESTRGRVRSLLKRSRAWQQQATSKVAGTKAWQKAEGYYRNARDAVGAIPERLQAEKKRLEKMIKDNPELSKIDLAKLVAGEYYDETLKKHVTSLDEIRGRLVDRAGNVIVDLKDRAKQARQSMGEALGRAKTSFSEGLSALGERVEQDVGMGMLVRQGDRQIELLEGILDVLENGDFGSEPGTGDGKRKRGLMNRSLRGLGRGLGGFARRYANFAMGVWKAPFQAARAAGRGLSRALSFGQDYLGDIYVEGGRVALTRVKMNNGDYQDVKTGKPVRKFSDIRGAVLDKSAEPPLMVLTQEEFDKGLYDSNGRKLGRKLLGAIGAIGNALGKIGGGYLSMVTAPFQAITWATRKLRSVNTPRDVYVKRDMSKPAVSVADMRAGIVFKADRKTVVKTINDIFNSGGGVFKLIDGTLQEVISLEDLRAGLVDFRGKALKPTGPGILGIARGAATGLVSGYAKTMGAILGLGRDLVVGTARRLGNWLNPRNRSMSASDASVVLLQQIYSLLDERLQKPKRIRKGSWEDQLANRKAGAGLDRDDDGEEGGLRSFSVLGALKKMFGFGGDDEEDEDEGGDTTIIGGFGGGGDRGNKYDSRGRKRGGWRRNMAARRRGLGRAIGRSKLGRLLGVGGLIGGARSGMGGMAKKAGFLSRMGSKMRGFRLGSPLAMAAGMLGGGYLINKLGGEDSKLGGAASTAMNVAGLASLATMIPGVSGAASAVGTGLGALATGAAGLLSAPVLIGAAVVAGAGYLAYKGFKKYKYGSYLPLRAFRMAQYGVNWKESSQVEKIVDLEQLLEEHVRVQGDQAVIDTGGKIEMKEVYKLFGIADGWFSSNEEDQAKFNAWFVGRFKPVYCKWIAAVRATKNNMRLNDADESLSKEQKLTVLRSANGVAAGIYSFEQGPFDGKALEVMGDAVNDAYKTALLEVDKGNEGTSVKDKMSNAMRSAASMGMLGLPGLVMSKLHDGLDDSNRAKGLENEQQRINRLMGVGAVAAGAAAGATLAATATLPGTGSGAKPVRALEAIRLRAYGLKEMVSDRVGVLIEMERQLIESAIAFKGPTATLTISATEALERFGPSFGVNMADDRQRKTWTNWFENRFAVVLLSFVSAATQIDKSVSPTQIDLRQGAENLIKIAQAIIGATVRVFFTSTSIWTFIQSPWAEDQGGFTLNNDASTTQESMEVLKARKQEKTVAEERGAPKAQADFSNVQSGASATVPAASQNRTQSFGNVPHYTAAVPMADRRPFGPGDLRIAANAPTFDSSNNQALAPQGVEQIPYKPPVKLSGAAKQNELALLQVAMENGITDPTELAIFMAHTAHESAKFTATEEDIRWRPETMRRLWPNRFPTLEAAKAVHARGYPAVAETVYGNRMGNDQPGDGFKFRGRGFMQLTGKANYKAFQQHFGRKYGIDVLKDPDLVAKDPKIAALSAVHWWLNRGGNLRTKAQQGDVVGTTRLVNGGENGLADRRQLFASYQRNIGELVKQAESGGVSFGDALGRVASAPGGYQDMLERNAANRVDTAPAPRGVLNVAAVPSSSGFVPETTPQPSERQGQTRLYQEAMREQDRVSRTVDTQSRSQRQEEDSRTKVMEDLQREQLVHLKSIDVQMGEVVTVLKDISARDVVKARGNDKTTRTTSPMRARQTDDLSDTPRVSVRRNVNARA